jgi:ketosteroid isomerase-like protein
MRFLVYLPFMIIMLSVIGCEQEQPKQDIFDDAKKEAVVSEVKEQFNSFVTVINEKETAKWAEFYSDENFISAIAGVEFFPTKTAWVDAISNYFSMRKSQKMTVIKLNMKALSEDKVILTCEDNTEFILDDDSVVMSKHFFTLLWHKEQNGWKIIYSHESWDDLLVE